MPDPVYDYPLDLTGVAPANLVSAETQIITAVNSDEYHIIIPNFAPFYKAGFVVINAATTDPLVEGVDFLFTHYFKDATIGTAQPVYGSITLLNKNFAGVLTMAYQTVGGRWTLEESIINEILNNKMLNPRQTTWEQVAATPVVFPVADHVHIDDADMTGMLDVVESLDTIAQAIIDSNASSKKQQIIVAVGDEVTHLTVGTNKVVFRTGYGFLLSDIRASLTTAQVDDLKIIVDVLVDGVSILSTKLSIDNTSKTSAGATVPLVISTSMIPDNAEVTIDILQVGAATVAAGLKVNLIGKAV